MKIKFSAKRTPEPKEYLIGLTREAWERTGKWRICTLCLHLKKCHFTKIEHHELGYYTITELPPIYGWICYDCYHWWLEEEERKRREAEEIEKKWEEKDKRWEEMEKRRKEEGEEKRRKRGGGDENGLPWW